MTKNSDHYYKAKVGDRARMFRDTSLEGLGVYTRLADFSFDSDPMGFLVDHHHRPYDLKRLADAIGEKNNRFAHIYAEVRQQRLILTVPEYDELLARLARRNKRSKRVHEIFTKLVGDVWPEAPTALKDFLVVPEILDQRLESLYAQRNGVLGGNPGLSKNDGEDNPEDILDVNLPLLLVVNPEDNLEVKPQSHSQSQILESPKRETPSVARETRLPSAAKVDWLLEQHRKFEAEPIVQEMKLLDPEAYAAAFEQRVGGYSPEEFDELRRALAEERRGRVSAMVLRMPRVQPRRNQMQLALAWSARGGQW